MTAPTATANAIRLALQHSRDEHVEAEPERGLFLHLAHTNGAFYLTLRRETAYPTLSEAETWAEAFGVPDGIDSMSRRSWTSTHPKTQRALRWCACTFTWRELLT
jgi:hypothetical protein